MTEEEVEGFVREHPGQLGIVDLAAELRIEIELNLTAVGHYRRRRDGVSHMNAPHTQNRRNQVDASALQPALHNLEPILENGI
jgi:hypothetical protein